MDSVLEDAAPGTLIFNLEVVDADSNFSYRQFFIVSGNERQHMAVSESGALTVHKQLNREETDSYQLEIALTDGVFTTFTHMQIIVTDVNGMLKLYIIHYY